MNTLPTEDERMLFSRIAQAATLDYNSWFKSDISGVVSQITNEDRNDNDNSSYNPDGLRHLIAVISFFEMVGNGGPASVGHIYREINAVRQTGPFTWRLYFSHTYLNLLKKIDTGYATYDSKEYLREAVKRMTYANKRVGNSRALTPYIANLLGEPPNLSDLVCRHGSGAVSERISNAEKLGLVFPSWGAKALFSRHSAYHTELIPQKPHSRIAVVPKDVNKPRIIACESSGLQFMQLGLMEWMYHKIERSTPCVHFTSQDYQHAQLDSKGLTVSTIDLSDASDHVRRSLVFNAFPKRWRRLLKRLTSQRISYVDGKNGTQRIQPIRTFAPMGSALCFPTLAIIVYAICRQQGLKESEFSVYGDDLIVPTWSARGIMSAMVSYGLVVNVSKSFTTGSFYRESCGYDIWYDRMLEQHDVTPCYLRHYPWDSRFISSGPALVRELDARGFTQLSDALVETMVQRMPHKWLCYAMAGDDVTHFPIRFKELLGIAPTKYNPDSQCHQVLTVGSKTKKRKTNRSNQLYSLWLHRNRKRGDLSVNPLMSRAPFSKGEAVIFKGNSYEYQWSLVKM